MKYLFLILSCLLFSAQSSAGQSVEGIITGEDGLGIPGVNILIEGTLIGAASDVDGRYLIEDAPAGTIVLRFSAIGFFDERRTIRLEDLARETVSVTLKEKILLADEVVVSASRREQPALSVPVSISVLSSDDLLRRNTIVLDDALRTVSGVHILGNQINIRGSSGFAYNTGSRVLLMLDGMPLLTPDSDGIPLEALPTTEIERVEVLKGPGSALYGSGALGGVINVVTRDLPDQPTTTIKTFGGLWDPVRHKVWRDGWKHGDEYRPFWGVSASHATRKSPGFGWWTSLTFRRDAGFTALSGRDVFHGFAKTSWRPRPSIKIESLVGIMARQRDNFLFWNSARDVLNPGRVSFGEDASAVDQSPNGAPDDFVRQISFLPVFTHFVNSKVFYEVRLRAFGTLVQPIDDDTQKRKDLSEGTLGARYGGEFQGNWIPNEDRRVVVGFSRDAITTKSSFFVTTDGDALGGQPEVAMFTHIEEQLSSTLQLVGGLRYDHYRIDASKTESRVSPKISLAYEWRPKNLIRVAWGHGFRVPSFAERFTDNREFLPIVRNLELKPERSQSFEVGIRGVSPFGSLGLVSWDASAFWNTYQRFIEPRLVPAEQAFQFVNLGDATIVGAESMLEWRTRSGDVQASVGYTYLSSEEADSGDELPFRPKHHIVSTLEVRLIGSLRAGADFRYTSEPDRVESDFARFVTDAGIMVDTKVLDLRLSAQKGPVKLAILINNALEYHYVDRPALLGEPRRFTFQATWTR